MLYAHHVPLGACRRIRHGAAEAEVWPGSWSADHITIADPATRPGSGTMAATRKEHHQ
jgi:hypothetical protein